MFRVNQAEYSIPILLVAPQEYVNIYSTRRVGASIQSGSLTRSANAAGRSERAAGRADGSLC